MKALADAYLATYQALYEAKPITCSVTGTIFDAVPAPCAALLDVSLSIDMIHVTVDGDARFTCYVFTSSTLPFLYCMLPGQSAGVLCQ